MNSIERSALLTPAKTRIFLLVLDGLGGLPQDPLGPTELEKAYTPHLDDLARESITGLHVPVAPGITPGSGPGHLSLFGYDPVQYAIGRGVLSALGSGYTVAPGEVAARGNFCTVDAQGVVTDRRAGRIATEKSRELCDRIRERVTLEGGSYRIGPVKDYRFTLILEGEGLSGEVEDTDPQETGLKPLPPVAYNAAAERTAELVGEFIDKASDVIGGEEAANMFLLRGFSTMPQWPTFQELFGLRGAVAASYPMYRGVSRLVGMDVLEHEPGVEQELQAIERNWQEYDFFFMHIKPTDSAGEDGDFDRKVSLIEEADGYIPAIRKLQPDVLIVTGDHSTPAVMRSHSWHPVPVLLWSRYCRPDRVDRFGERDVMLGGLGPRMPAVDLMPLAVANARRFKKFGA